jgi:hypothetical protein
MSEDNVKLGYRAADAFNRRDLGAFLALQDDDVQGVPLAVDMPVDDLPLPPSRGDTPCARSAVGARVVLGPNSSREKS